MSDMSKLEDFEEGDKNNSEKIKNLKENIEIQKKTKERLIALIKKQSSTGNAIANLSGDLEDLKKHLESQNNKIEAQKTLNKTVEEKLSFYKENMQKTVKKQIFNKNLRWKD